MNSLGYAFEGFDSLGRSRSMEKIYTTATGTAVTSLPIDTQSIIPDLRPSLTTIRDSKELAADLADNDRAMMCFISKLKKFEARTNSTDADGCQLNSSLRSLYGAAGNQGTVRDAIKNLILSSDFKIWSY